MSKNVAINVWLRVKGGGHEGVIEAYVNFPSLPKKGEEIEIQKLPGIHGIFIVERVSHEQLRSDHPRFDPVLWLKKKAS